jgi:hypothetical protein
VALSLRAVVHLYQPGAANNYSEIRGLQEKQRCWHRLIST